MKSIDLLNVFNKQEQKQLEKEIKDSKKKYLKETYQAIKKAVRKGDVPDKENLYRAIFKQKYTSSKDYRLRHALRVLNEVLEDFLVRAHFERNYKQETFESELRLLDHYRDRKAYDLYEKQWNKSYKQAKEVERFDQVHTLLERQFFLLTERIREDSSKVLAVMRSSIDEMVENIRQYAVEEFLVAQQLAAFSEAVYKQIQPNRAFALPDVPLVYEKQIEEHPITSRFLYHVIQQYVTSGQQKIEHIQEALRLIDEVDKKRPKRSAVQSKFTLLGILAVEHSSVGENQAADSVYEELIPLAIEQKVHNLPGLLYNYLMNSLHLKHYEKVAKLYDTHQETLNLVPQIQRLALFARCWAHLYLDQTEAAFDLLLSLPLTKLPEHDYYYARMFYLTLYFEMGDWDNVERELTNIYQAINYKPLQNPTFRTQVDFYKQLFKTINTPDADERRAAKAELRNDIDTLIGQQPATHNMLVKWVEEQLKKRI